MVALASWPASARLPPCARAAAEPATAPHQPPSRAWLAAQARRSACFSAAWPCCGPRAAAPAAGPKDYLNAALITLGCTLFLMTGSVKSKHAGASSSLFGLLLMLGYLGFDGFTSTFQVGG